MRKTEPKQGKMFFTYTRDFFDCLRAELHSERTVDTYRQSLNAFRTYLQKTYSKGVDKSLLASSPNRSYEISY